MVGLLSENKSIILPIQTPNPVLNYERANKNYKLEGFNVLTGAKTRAERIHWTENWKNTDSLNKNEFTSRF